MPTVIVLIAAPLAALLAIEASVVISSAATDIRLAQQYSGLVTVPFFFVYIAAEVTLGLDAVTLLLISGVMALAAAGLYFVNLRTFRRDEILTRWK